MPAATWGVRRAGEARVLAVLGDSARPLTSAEIADLAQLGRSAVDATLRRLRRRGLVQLVGTTRTGARGPGARVWRRVGH